MKMNSIILRDIVDENLKYVFAFKGTHIVC